MKEEREEHIKSEQTKHEKRGGKAEQSPAAKADRKLDLAAQDISPRLHEAEGLHRLKEGVAIRTRAQQHDEIDVLLRDFWGEFRIELADDFGGERKAEHGGVARDADSDDADLALRGGNLA